MSDLHFTVEDTNESGGDNGGIRPTIIQPHEVPIAGEMDHLPNHATTATTTLPSGMMNAPAVTTATTSTSTGTTERSTLEYMQEQLNSSSHPTVVIFHILFKIIALFLYIFGGWFLPTSSTSILNGGNNNGGGGGSFITLTVIIILLLAADFWVVKNVTGRLLVGLRWWNKVDAETTTWIFESHEQSERPKNINPFDKSIFWFVLYVTPCIWLGLLLLAILKLELNWLMVCIMAISLSSSNVYGYYKCSSDQKARFQQLGVQVTQQGAAAVMRSNMMSVLTGQGTVA